MRPIVIVSVGWGGIIVDVQYMRLARLVVRCIVWRGGCCCCYGCMRICDCSDMHRVVVGVYGESDRGARGARSIDDTGARRRINVRRRGASRATHHTSRIEAMLW